MGRTDYYILYDADLSFREIIRRHHAGEPLITEVERTLLMQKFFKEELELERKKQALKDKEKKEASKKSEPSAEKELKSPKKEVKEEVKAEKEVKTEKENEEEKMETDEKVSVKEEPEKSSDSKSEEEKTEKSVEGEAQSTDEKSEPESSESKKDENTEPKKEEPPAEEKNSEKEEEKEENAETEEKSEKPKTDDKSETSEADDKSEKPKANDKSEEISAKTEENSDSKPCSTNNADKLNFGDGKHDVKDILRTLQMENLDDMKNKETALLNLQQMDEAMAKIGPANIESLASTEPTVAQLLAQSAANPIKWPKERALQNRVEHIMYAVEKNRWPVDKYFQTTESEARELPLPHQQLQQQQLHQMQESERQRAVEAEVERAHIQALLHPNLHHTLGLSKASAITASSLRSYLESEGRDKHSVSDSHALRQLQALQGQLDLTIQPVSSGSGGGAAAALADTLASLAPPRRGPGRPRLDDPLRAAEKRLAEQLHSLQPQEKKRRKLDEIVLGLTSKCKSPEQTTSSPKDSLSLLRGSSVSLLSARDKSIVTNAISSPRLSTSISISQASDVKKDSSKGDERHSKNTDGSSRLVKQSDLPPGINLPPGIELYRPNDVKVGKWLEQHEGLLTNESSSSTSEGSSSSKKRRTEDWSSQLTGEEHVSLVNNKTGHKVC